MICKHCYKEFPSSIVIDGKRRILSKRKYCLECSPFGSHRTRPIDYVCKTSVPESRPKIILKCCSCGRHYDLSEKRGHTKKHCNSCVVNRRREKIKSNLIKNKGGKCQKCGYDKCIDALEFHHRDPSKKEFQVNSSVASISFNKLLLEIDKCDLLCANCHREEHAKINQKLKEERIKSL